MKLGMFNSALNDKSFDETCKIYNELGMQMIELGAGGYSYSSHIKPDVILNDAAALQAVKDTLKKYNLTVSAVSCHGNQLHPREGARKGYQKAMTDGVLVAEALGVDTICCFSGCPGDGPGAKYPNWICTGQQEMTEDVLKWQWNEVVIPYWKDFVAFAKSHGVTKIAIEMYAGMVVYNTETLLRLREAVGPEIGCNFDPTHIRWQGMQPVAVIRALGEAIFHVHGKDSFPNKEVIAVNGILDQRPYWGDEKNRAWVFRTVGFGFSAIEWKAMVNALLMVGYDGVISIEHEDALMEQMEGIRKSAEFLKEVIPFEKTSDLEWRKEIEQVINDIEYA